MSAPDLEKPGKSKLRPIVDPLYLRTARKFLEDGGWNRWSGEVEDLAMRLEKTADAAWQKGFKAGLNAGQVIAEEVRNTRRMLSRRKR